MTQEALKLALEALELTNRSDMRQVNEAITAIKEALAQPTLQEQLDKAYAACDKTHAKWRKADADCDKAHADWYKDKAEINRIETLMEQTK